MKLVFAEQAREGYLCWRRQDKRLVKRINELIDATVRAPFCGIACSLNEKILGVGFTGRAVIRDG